MAGHPPLLLLVALVAFGAVLPSGGAPPPGSRWVYRNARFGLSTPNPRTPSGASGAECDVWALATGRHVGHVDQSGVSAGGPDAACLAVSQSGRFVLFDHSRNELWKRVADNQPTRCNYAVLAPDEQSCMQTGTSPFADQETFDISWCTTEREDRATCKVITTVTSERGAHSHRATYCAAGVLVVDQRTKRLVVNARSGAVLQRLTIRSGAALDCGPLRDLVR